MAACPTCGYAPSEKCCEEASALKAAHQEEQRRRRELFSALGIEYRENPSRTIAGSWDAEPHLPSLIAFLARLPCGPGRSELTTDGTDGHRWEGALRP